MSFSPICPVSPVLIPLTLCRWSFRSVAPPQTALPPLGQHSPCGLQATSYLAIQFTNPVRFAVCATFPWSAWLLLASKRVRERQQRPQDLRELRASAADPFLAAKEPPPWRCLLAQLDMVDRREGCLCLSYDVCLVSCSRFLLISSRPHPEAFSLGSHLCKWKSSAIRQSSHVEVLSDQPLVPVCSHPAK